MRCDREGKGPPSRGHQIRDLPAFDRRVRLVWSKRRFLCPSESRLPVQTWTERSHELSDPHVLSARAGRECTHAVGQEARSVASLARWLCVSWATVISAVRDYGTALVNDPGRIEQGPTSPFANCLRRAFGRICVVREPLSRTTA
jgi:transposase